MRVWPIISVLALTTASGANATIYEVGLNGTIVSQTTPGFDPYWNVGDRITFRARFDDSWVMTFEGSDALFAGLYGLPTSGEQFFSISGDGGVWKTADEIDDGYPVFSDIYFELHEDGSYTEHRRELGNPSIAIRNGKVSAFSGYMVPVSSPRAVLNLGSGLGGGRYCSNDVPGGPVSCQTGFSEFSSDRFTIEGNTYLYGNSYFGPDFTGRWDFEHSYAHAIPEPATWAMMLIGFAGAGTAIRQRKPSLAAA